MRENRKYPTELERTGPNYSGSKYQDDLDVVDIAKLIRADIKTAIKTRKLSPLKASVRIQRYAGGRSIDVTITGIEGAEAKAAADQIELLTQAYNYDFGDSMSDYFCVNFYTHVNYTR